MRRGVAGVNCKAKVVALHIAEIRTIPFRFKFTKDCLYLYNDDRMEVIHLDSDSSMPLYYIGDSVLEYNEKEDSIFVYAYDPSRKGDDYYLGCYKPYDASSLIEIGQKELEHYK